MKRNATAVWNGTIKEGKGVLTSQSKALDHIQYSFKSRFEDGVGTNPEELMAAAHAGCFAMKLSADLTEAGYKPEKLEAKSVVSLEEGVITRSELSVVAKVPQLDNVRFQEIAMGAKANCPVSKAYKLDITLTATLEA